MAVDLDPKAVTCDELFGIINPATREWKDGRWGAGVTSGTAAVPSGVGLSETPSVPGMLPGRSHSLRRSPPPQKSQGASAGALRAQCSCTTRRAGKGLKLT